MIATVFGLLLGSAILLVTRRRGVASGELAAKPTALGWLTLAFGLTAAIAFALAALQIPGGDGAGVRLWSLSVALTVAAVMVGAGALARHDRRWPTWAGLVAVAGPAVLWLAFAIGNVLGLGA